MTTQDENQTTLISTILQTVSSTVNPENITVISTTVDPIKYKIWGFIPCSSSNEKDCLEYLYYTSASLILVLLVILSFSYHLKLINKINYAKLYFKTKRYF
jgi:hypothetical protein